MSSPVQQGRRESPGGGGGERLCCGCELVDGFLLGFYSRGLWGFCGELEYERIFVSCKCLDV